MKKLPSLLIILFPFFHAFSQSDTVRYLFMGHTRDDNRDYEHVLKTIEKIDYTKYCLTLLGGDLTWNTSAERSTLEYCDKIFHLGSDSTHLSTGNHDLDNLSLLLEFTKKPRFYAITRNNIVFVIMNTEVSSPDIKDEQLAMIQNVADSIEKADYLVIIHHRILWMVGVPELAYLMDSVAASTKNLTHTNFYSDVYPLLQKVKNKGIEILCLAGDRTDVNITYYPEDSITFLASGMRGTAPDDSNYAIVLTQVLSKDSLEWNYVNLSNMDTLAESPVISTLNERTGNGSMEIFPNPTPGIVNVWLKDFQNEKMQLEILNQNGEIVYSKWNLMQNTPVEIILPDKISGVYYIRASNNQEIIIGKLIIIR